MSCTELHIGKLIKFDIGEQTLEEFADKVIEEHKGWFEDSDASPLENIKNFPEEYGYAIIGDDVYRIHNNKEIDSCDGISHFTVSSNGDIDYVLQFHNGGTGFGEELAEICDKIASMPKDLEPEKVLVDKKEYERLIKSDKLVDALEVVGVNNWEGYGEARRMVRDGRTTREEW